MKFVKYLTSGLYRVLPLELEISIRRRRLRRLESELQTLEELKFRFGGGNKNELINTYFDEDLDTLQESISSNRIQLARLEN